MIDGRVGWLSDNVPALTSLIGIMDQSASDEGRFTDDRREQSSRQLEARR